MKRRDFLRNSTLAGATTFVAAACNPSTTKTTAENEVKETIDDLPF